MDGNGVIAFNNASAHADILKAGVFGANGVLNIGGGTLSADMMLKIYAPGGNGELNFVLHVTLCGERIKNFSGELSLIFFKPDGTICGKGPREVFTNKTE